MNKTILACEKLSKFFVETDNKITVLDEVNFTIGQAETVAILGASGSGKSTFLHLLSGLDKPTEGRIFWQDRDIHQLNEKQRCRLRNSQLGFVYQFHHLLPEFTALENVAIPLLIQQVSVEEATERAANLLAKVGLKQRESHKPGQLSGGERQRVAIARALVTNPLCVLADEPTGNLDQHTSEAVLDVMFALQQSLQTSFVVVTHNESLAKRFMRSFCLMDGKLHVKEMEG